MKRFIHNYRIDPRLILESKEQTNEFGYLNFYAFIYYLNINVMSRRRTVDASTLLDLTWSTNHFPLPAPDGASPLRPARNTIASTSSAHPSISQTPPRKGLIHSTPQVQPQRCLETPPRRSLVIAMTDDDDDEVPMSPRGAPDGRVEIEDIEEVDEDVGRGRPSVDRSSRLGSLGGGRTETEDDESSSSDEDDQSDVSDIFVREEEPVSWECLVQCLN